MIEVRIPSSAKGLRIKHFKSMSAVPIESETLTKDDVTYFAEAVRSASNSLVFLSDFTGLRYGQLLDFTTSDIRKMTSSALKAISEMNLDIKLPESIVLGGKKFNRVDPDKIGIGWHIDFADTSITKDPVRMACLFYLPEGYNYSDMDENGNITHPIASRYELFDEEFPLELFIASANFFLRKSLRSTRASMVKQLTRERTRRKISSALQKLSLFYGRLQLKRLWKHLTLRGNKR